MRYGGYLETFRIRSQGQTSPFRDFVNALAIPTGVRCEDRVLVFCRHLVLLRKLQGLGQCSTLHSAYPYGLNDRVNTLESGSCIRFTGW